MIKKFNNLSYIYVLNINWDPITIHKHPTKPIQQTFKMNSLSEMLLVYFVLLNGRNTRGWGSGQNASMHKVEVV